MITGVAATGLGVRNPVTVGRGNSMGVGVGVAGVGVAQAESAVSAIRVAGKRTQAL